MVDILAGYTKLMLLIEEGDIEGVYDLLDKGTDVNAQNKIGQTALILASKYGVTPAVERLIRSGADVNIKNKFGQTALHAACSKDYEEIASILIECGADVNVKDTRGWTPLMIACYNDAINIVKLLLDNGADILAQDGFGKSAVNRTRSPEIHQLLMEYAQRELEVYKAGENDYDQEEEVEGPHIPLEEYSDEREQRIAPQSQLSNSQSKQSQFAHSQSKQQAESGFSQKKQLQSSKTTQSLQTSNQRTKGSVATPSNISVQRSPKRSGSGKLKTLDPTASPKGVHPYSYKKMQKLLDLDPRRADHCIHPATILPHQKQQKIEQRKQEQAQREQISQIRQSQRDSPFHRSRLDSPAGEAAGSRSNRYRYRSPEQTEPQSFQQAVSMRPKSSIQDNSRITNSSKQTSKPFFSESSTKSPKISSGLEESKRSPQQTIKLQSAGKARRA